MSISFRQFLRWDFFSGVVWAWDHNFAGEFLTVFFKINLLAEGKVFDYLTVRALVHIHNSDCY